ncbi:hypothetical protein E4U43_001296 [Claviceps pusilla]|uniref:BZIP domain-containing protein n=1 Tax=Claviceps pusilla TaxID=123648 RepID=A0A9P7N8R6_9HYPO|nr:hypothetical protein E4U43_001296 [Claviceps pusilla]
MSFWAVDAAERLIVGLISQCQPVLLGHQTTPSNILTGTYRTLSVSGSRASEDRRRRVHNLPSLNFQHAAHLITPTFLVMLCAENVVRKHAVDNEEYLISKLILIGLPPQLVCCRHLKLPTSQLGSKFKVPPEKQKRFGQMTTESAHIQQRANLARIRDNQRRSRARRREYLQELEQRLRACELQGIEASTEVQIAARRVADENTKLRELLHKHGVTDDYIAQYLQENAANKDDYRTGKEQNVQAIDAGFTPTSQFLQQLMLPRRAVHLEPSAQVTLPSHSSREASTASGSTIISSAWKDSQPIIANFSHQPQQLVVPSSTIGSSDHQQYPASVFLTESGRAQPDLFQRSRSEHLADTAQQVMVTPQPIPIDDHSVMSYHFQMNSIHNAAHRHGPHGAI